MARASPGFRRRNAAFTLIEVLVALAIVAIGMLVVIQSVSQTANNSAYLRDKTLAHWVAMNQLTLMRLSQSPPAKGTSSGDADMAGQKWHWTAQVTQTAIDSMLRIDVGVRAIDAEDDSQIASVTGFVGTKIGKPGVLVAQYSPAVVTVGGATTTTTTTTPIAPGAPATPGSPAAQPIGEPTVPPITPPSSPPSNQPLIPGK